MRIKVIPPDRVADSWGAGHFGASRGTRTHNGIDQHCPINSKILSPVKGTVTKLGYCYNDDLSYRYVEITTSSRKRHRMLYVNPVVEKGQRVDADSVLGILQDLDRRYNNITPHVHYEIIDEDGNYLNPDDESIESA